MTRLSLAGAWYSDVCLLEGEYVALYRDSHIQTSRGRVELPGENVLFLRCAINPKTSALEMGGQGHVTGKAWRWNGQQWTEQGYTAGQQKPVAFGPLGFYVAVSAVAVAVFGWSGEFLREEPAALGSGGIQYVTAAGEVVTGDSTYQSKQLAEWTQLGDLRIGGGYEGGALFLSNGELRELEPGGCYFIHGYRDGSRLAVSTVKQDEDRAVLFWLDVSEIPSLPLVTQNPLPTTPNPETPRPEPTPVSIPNLFDTIAAVRAKYPTPLGASHAAFLIEAVTAAGHDLGLVKKETGVNILLPSGQRVSQDVFMRPDGQAFDVLRDGDGAAEPQWSEIEPIDPARYYRVTAAPQPTPQPIPQPVPQPIPSPSPSPLLLEQRVAQLERRLERLENAGLLIAPVYKP